MREESRMEGQRGNLFYRKDFRPGGRKPLKCDKKTDFFLDNCTNVQYLA